MHERNGFNSVQQRNGFKCASYLYRYSKRSIVFIFFYRFNIFLCMCVYLKSFSPQNINYYILPFSFGRLHSITGGHPFILHCEKMNTLSPYFLLSAAMIFLWATQTLRSIVIDKRDNHLFHVDYLMISLKLFSFDLTSICNEMH